MNTVLIGQNNSGKPKTFASLFSYYAKANRPVLILDYKNRFKDYAHVTLSIDDVNPTLEPIGYQDMIALNAGYEKWSHLLYTKSVEVLREHHQESPYANQPFEEVLYQLKKDMLLKMTVDRLANAWEKIESQYGEEFFDKISMNKMKKHISPTELVEEILQCWKEGKIVRLTRKKNIKSERLCAITFLIILRLAEQTEQPFMLFTHELNIWKKGNTKLFLDTVNTTNIDFVLSFVKTSDVPSFFIPYLSHLGLFSLADKRELHALSEWGKGLAFLPSTSYRGWYELTQEAQKEEAVWKRINFPFTRSCGKSTKCYQKTS